jgi:hypothetical protein
MNAISLNRADSLAIRNIVWTETAEDIADVRERYLNCFHSEVTKFVEDMSLALVEWQNLNARPDGDEKKEHVLALAYSAINLHIISMRLFLAGYLLAAGNVQRQVLESIALALLGSDNSLDVLCRFISNQYSTKNAVRDLHKHAKRLGIKENFARVLKKARDFYNAHSHAGFISVGGSLSFSNQGAWHLGASFDEGKIANYRNEIEDRLDLARVFRDFISAVQYNLEKW